MKKLGLLIVVVLFSGCFDQEVNDRETLELFNHGGAIACYNKWGGEIVTNSSWKYAENLNKFYKDDKSYKLENCEIK